jgi:NitT/TauT family transport system permease protein
VGADLKQEIALYIGGAERHLGHQAEHERGKILRERCMPMFSAKTCSGGGRACNPRPLPFVAPVPRVPIWTTGVVAGLTWLGFAAITQYLPDIDDFERTGLCWRRSPWCWPRPWRCCWWPSRRCKTMAARSGAAWRRCATPALADLLLAVALSAWELVTAKFLLLPRPFFASPQALLEVFTDDYPRLGDSVWHSVLLLAGGYVIGAAVGLRFGVAIGWSRAVGYWAHPVLRLIGPLPATAWLPLAFFAFPVQP